ncbi:MAG: ORF6N domain-containing protein [Deltaproteobacteria bacterium]|nr:ORF6N domain-containing protein [Deltaproteobacteria bacterium]
MIQKLIHYAAGPVESLIFAIRGQRVILDADLARIYGVPTKRLNEQVRRNADRFPSDFLIQLTTPEAKEIQGLRSQFATLKRGQHIKHLPYAFTEHGAIMAATVLNSPEAIQMSVFVVRAFVRMRALLGDTRELARRLAALEQELKERLDVHEVAIVSILQRVMDLIDPPVEPKPTPRKKIGFEIKEPRTRYRTVRG